MIFATDSEKGRNFMWCTVLNYAFMRCEYNFILIDLCKRYILYVKLLLKTGFFEWYIVNCNSIS